MADTTELAHAVADRYELLRVLGKGGMATVYLARDRKHHRDVALKVLRPDLTASLGSDRFLKEIEIAARLTHPHILPLHDSGESGGFLYYVMPFIDGPSLRAVLERERRLEVAAALAIAVPVADALGYAHRTGFFHRDIKPENILFSQGHPIVADFGIAKAISTAGGANLTRTGFPVGTPGYMSPEQAAGLTDLDARTDVYSLAAVIYEMVIGEVPRGWPLDDSVKAGKFLEAPTAHQARLAQAGARVEAALVRAMSIRHADRTASPARLMEELSAPDETGQPRRRFSDDEVREIVRRASELEATSPTFAGGAAVPSAVSRQPLADGSMTIGGVEALAGEVGIDSAFVRRAAASITPRSDPGLLGKFEEQEKPNWWLGGRTRLVYERVIDGEVPDVEFPMMVDEIRRSLRNVGQVSQLGRSFSWSSLRGQSGTGRNVEVVVAIRGGRTRIGVHEALGNLIGGIYGGIGGGMGGGGLGPLIGILAEGLGVPGPLMVGMIIPMWLTVTFATARTSYYYSVRRRERQLERLADQLAELARELIPARLGREERMKRLASPP